MSLQVGALHSLRSNLNSFQNAEFESTATELSQRIPPYQKAKRRDHALVVKNQDDNTYSAIVVELKFGNKNAEESLNQIKDKEDVKSCKLFLQQHLPIQMTLTSLVPTYLIRQ